MTSNQPTSNVFTECYARDNYVCQDCYASENLEIHHILPIGQGGKNTLDNLKTVCRNCHVKNYKDIHYPKDKSKILPLEKREKRKSGINSKTTIQKLLNFPTDSVDRVEDYQFETRKKTFTEAVMELIEMGLESTKEKPAE